MYHPPVYYQAFPFMRGGPGVAPHLNATYCAVSDPLRCVGVSVANAAPHDAPGDPDISTGTGPVAQGWRQCAPSDVAQCGSCPPGTTRVDPTAPPPRGTSARRSSGPKPVKHPALAVLPTVPGCARCKALLVGTQWVPRVGKEGLGEPGTGDCEATCQPGASIFLHVHVQ